MSNFLDHFSQRVLLCDGASRGKRARVRRAASAPAYVARARIMALS
jgi:hypothetical protein